MIRDGYDIEEYLEQLYDMVEVFFGDVELAVQTVFLKAEDEVFPETGFGLD